MAATKRTMREDRGLWFIRLLQFILMLVALGIYGSAAHGWSDQDGCNVPARTAWNVACACLTFFFLLYLIPTTGPLSLTRFWNKWVQIGLDALFVVFWIATAVTSHATCSDLCNACSAHYNIYPYWFKPYSGSVQCFCAPGQSPVTLSSKRSLENMLMGRAPLSSSTITSGAKLGEATISIAAKSGCAAALVILFIITLLYGLWKIYEEHSAAKAPQPETEELNGQNTAYKTEPMVTEARV